MDGFQGAAKRVRILVVDDCAVMRSLLCGALEAEGYSVWAVASGTAALQVAEEQDLDAVVLDVEMPGMDGLAVGRALRGLPRTALARIAMHTSLPEGAVRAGFSGYDRYLPKPLDPLGLRQEIEALLRETSPLPLAARAELQAT